MRDIFLMPFFCEGVGVLPSVRMRDIFLLPLCCDGVGILLIESA